MRFKFQMDIPPDDWEKIRAYMTRTAADLSYKPGEAENEDVRAFLELHCRASVAHFISEHLSETEDT